MHHHAGYRHPPKFPLGCFVVSSCYTHGFLKQAPQAFLFTARDKSHHFRALFRAAVESCVLLESLDEWATGAGLPPAVRTDSIGMLEQRMLGPALSGGCLVTACCCSLALRRKDEVRTSCHRMHSCWATKGAMEMCPCSMCLSTSVHIECFAWS